MSSRHNKKRNTAVLYKVLVREYTKRVMGDGGEDDIAKMIMKEIKNRFSFSSVLGKELKLFLEIEKDDLGVDESRLRKLITEIKLSRSAMDSKRIYDEQGKVISFINSSLGSDSFSNFISEYKKIATLNSIFNDRIGVAEKIDLEDKLVGMLMEEEKSLVMEDDGIPLSLMKNLMSRRFSKKYSSLLSEQKELLKSYVRSEFGYEPEYKSFLNREIKRLKGKLHESLEECAALGCDIVMRENTEYVLNTLNEFKKRELNDKDVSFVMKVQELIKEMNNEQKEN